MVFAIIEFVRNKNLYLLLIIIPYAVFGELLLRYDILVLFLTGICIAATEDFIKKHYRYIVLIILTASVLLIYFSNVNIYRYTVAILIFILFFNLKVRFFQVGGFSYLLHLYHSPIIVTSFPLLALFITQPYLSYRTDSNSYIGLLYFVFIDKTVWKIENIIRWTMIQVYLCHKSFILLNNVDRQHSLW